MQGFHPAPCLNPVKDDYSEALMACLARNSLFNWYKELEVV